MTAFMDDAIIDNANFYKAKLMGTVFKRAILTNANFLDADVCHADFENADLSNANMECARIGSASFKNAKYSSKTQWPMGFDPREVGAVLVGDGAE